MSITDIIKGMRVKTLVAGAVPVLAAGAFAQKILDFNVFYFFLCLLLALFIQIATNFYNDAIDFKKGADTKRVGPERITAQGNQAYGHVMLAGHIFLFLSLMVAIPLFIKGGVVIVLLGTLSLFFAYGYTGGPFPLAYLGLGELFVFLFFGLIATIGSFYLITEREVNLSVFVLGCQLGLLSSVLIAINNYRDKDEDMKVEKRTLATKMSIRGYLRLIDFFLFFPYFLLLYFVFFVDLNYMFNLFSISIAYRVRDGLYDLSELEECNKLLGESAKHLAIFTLLFCVISLWK